MSLRTDLIRLAHQNPELRPALLPIIREAREFPTPEALKSYLEEHPDADKSKHTVQKSEKGEGGEEDDSEVPEWGSMESKVKGFLSKVKGISKSMVSAVAKAPKQVQKIVSDPDTRREAMSSVASGIKKSPEKIAKTVWEAAKKEVKEIKHAGHALGKVLAKPPEEWTKEDKKAVYAAAVYVAGAAVAAAGGGPLVAAGVLGKSFGMHVGMKALHHAVDSGFTHFELGESGLHGVEHVLHALEHLHFASEEGEDEALQASLIGNLTAAVAAVLEEGISDEEMQKILKGEEPDVNSIETPKAKSEKAKGKQAAGEIGPYIRFNNRLWVNDFGHKMSPKPGSWDRLKLCDKQGRPLKTEVEVTWGKPGELSVYENHRRQPTYKYEDVGVFQPTVTLKDIEKAPPEAKTLAKQVAAKIRAEGFGKDEARAVASDVAEDVNFHSLARALGGDSHQSSVDTGDISMALDFGVYSAGWFGVFLAQEFGDSSTAKVILAQMLEDTARWKQRELAESMRMASLHQQTIRLAYAKPELRPHLLPLLRVAFGGTRVAVKDLPPSVQRALKEVKYGRRDIEVSAASSFSFQSFGGDGYRDFTCILNMETGQTKVTYGSWGGPNPFTRGKPVDTDDRNHTIPLNGAIIQGTEGGGKPVYATIKVHPDNMATLIPAQIDLTREEKLAITILDSLKPAYRAEYFVRNDLGLYKADNPLIKSLVDKGLVKVTGTGIQITTAGKNARDPSVRV